MPFLYGPNQEGYFQNKKHGTLYSESQLEAITNALHETEKATSTSTVAKKQSTKKTKVPKWQIDKIKEIKKLHPNWTNKTISEHSDVVPWSETTVRRTLAGEYDNAEYIGSEEDATPPDPFVLAATQQPVPAVPQPTPDVAPDGRPVFRTAS